jgi:hypothetical protein
MALTKAEAIKQLDGPGSVSNQTALVKKMIGSSRKKTVRRLIPAGKTMTADLSPEQLPQAAYNWLRYCAHFTECTISLADDHTVMTTSTTKVLDFDTNTKNYEWDLRGKRWLAERVAECLKVDHLVALNIKKEGIYSIVDTTGEFSPESENWLPNVIMTPFRPPAF